MFYHSFDGARQRWVIGTAVSKDGFVWRKQGPVFAGSPEDDTGSFDCRGAAAAHVVRDFATKRCAVLDLETSANPFHMACVMNVCAVIEMQVQNVF